jgi:Zn-dependent peptidase ImmA (M78 family)
VSYVYRRRSKKTLRQIAKAILEAHPDRRIGEFAIDIEGIQEDLGLEIVYRPGLGLPVEGYIARDPKYIVLNEFALVYLPRARFTIAEEVCHKILEWGLWESGKIPKGARAHELSERQYRDIEENARDLAGEILEPESIFRQRWDHHRLTASQAGRTGDRSIRAVAQATGDDFIVSPYAAGLRARKLGIITPVEYRGNFPVLL